MLLAVLNMLPVTLLFLTLSLWASAALPSRGAAAAVSIAAVVVTYFLNMLGASVEMLETPRKLSPFYWSDASRILLHGFDWARAGALLALAALFLGLALWRFERRDIAVGAREFRLDLRALVRPFYRPAGRMGTHGGQQAAH
jgi:ABC-type transport system involved in multi-copper enzyme maturation permease subunit